MIQEVKGDLFTSNDSLLHCISKDLAMGKGIAKEFITRYGGRDVLKKQNIKVGSFGCLDIGNGRYVFCLVTKEKYFHKPTYRNLELSLLELWKYCNAKKITALALPRIGCGLDKLEWDKVKCILKKIFNGVRLTIYYL